MNDQADPLLATPPLALLEGASLFLDFDGTLVELADRPDLVPVGDDLWSLLSALRDRLDGRLAIVSGRSVATLRGAFGLEAFHLAGSHGLEQARPGGPVEAPARAAAIDDVQAALHAFAAGKPGLLVEEKSLGVGLHFRLAPEREAECRAICERLAAQTGLYLQEGKMLFELRPGEAGKGLAVDHLLAGTELGGGRPIFIGDDITDEDGFAAATVRGGCGILAGPPRLTAARYRLPDVAGVRQWLTQGEERLRNGD